MKIIESAVRLKNGITMERRVGGMIRLPMFDGKRRGWQMWPRVTQMTRTGRRFSNPLGTASFLMALVVVCGVAALIGGVLARQMRVERPHLTAIVPTGHLVEAGGLLLQVAAVTWLVHASAEAHRLRVDIRLQNPTNRPLAVDHREFLLRARNGGSWPASKDSLTPTTLEPRQTLTGSLFFERPTANPDLEMVWTRNQEKMVITIGRDAVHHPDGRGGWEEVKEN
jgi:hypothetical protein